MMFVPPAEFQKVGESLPKSTEAALLVWVCDVQMSDIVGFSINLSPVHPHIMCILEEAAALCWTGCLL